jgi:hypothetical protein
MAKRRYRRYRRKTTRWSSNLVRMLGNGNAPAASDFVDFYTIAQNNTQTSSSGTSQTFTVKNIEVSAQLEGSSVLSNIEYYIMFVPEGYPLANNLPEQHSEWIMAYKFIGTPLASIGTNAAITSNAQPPRIKTRLSRKLNSGDQVVFIIRGVNSSSNELPVVWSGLLRWWTKAN